MCRFVFDTIRSFSSNVKEGADLSLDSTCVRALTKSISKALLPNPRRKHRVSSIAFVGKRFLQLDSALRMSQRVFHRLTLGFEAVTYHKLFLMFS